MQVTSNRLRIVDKEDYGVDIEYNDMYAILHFPFMNKFNKRIFKDFEKTLPSIVDFIDTVGYEGLWAAIERDNSFVRKIAVRFGFSRIGESEGLVIYEYTGGTT